MKGAKGKAKGDAASRASPQQDSSGKSQTPSKIQPATPARASSSGKKKKPSIRLDTDDESDECGPSKKSQSVGRRARRSHPPPFLCDQSLLPKLMSLHLLLG